MNAMPFVPVANTVMVELRCLMDGQHVENTLYFERATAPTSAEMTALAAEMADWWAEEVADYTSVEVSLVEVYVTDLTSSTGPTASFVPGTLITGGLADVSLPNNVSLAVSFRTALRGRSHRGRNYVFGLTEGQIVKNTVQPAALAEIQGAYNQVEPRTTGLGWTWVVVSRYSGVDPVTGDPVPRAAGVTTPVNAVVITDPTVDSQRGRLPGRGQ